MVASGALRFLIEAIVTSVRGLTVSVHSETNLALLRGEIDSVDVRADTIEVNHITVSGGVALSVDRLRLFPLTNPFAVSVSATLTEADLNRAGPVRDAMQTLLRQVLRATASNAVGRRLPAGLHALDCILDYIRLDDAPQAVENDSPIAAFLGISPLQTPRPGRLVLEAHTYIDGRRVNFAVRGALGVDDTGTTVRWSSPELLWRRLAVPIFLIESVGVHLMPLTHVSRIEVFNQMLSVDGVVTVDPNAADLKAISQGR